MGSEKPAAQVRATIVVVCAIFCLIGIISLLVWQLGGSVTSLPSRSYIAAEPASQDQYTTPNPPLPSPLHLPADAIARQNAASHLPLVSLPPTPIPPQHLPLIATVPPQPPPAATLQPIIIDPAAPPPLHSVNIDAVTLSPAAPPRAVLSPAQIPVPPPVQPVEIATATLPRAATQPVNISAVTLPPAPPPQTGYFTLLVPGVATPLDISLHPSLKYHGINTVLVTDASKRTFAMDLQPASLDAIRRRVSPAIAAQQPATQPANAATALQALIDKNLHMEECRKFVMSMCTDQQGRLWVATEEDGEDHPGGVQCFDPSAPELHQWTQYTTADGLGDNNGYAVACDRKGRIWLGHLNHGVSVYNGQKWQTYEVVGGLSRPDTLSGPLGERVFHITVNPKDGDVWIATNAGLGRYSESKDTWQYYTRAEGLPSDQAASLAFDKDGNIYVATQCDGITMADAADEYQHWRTVKGPDDEPTTPTGDGLPSNLINDILVTYPASSLLTTNPSPLATVYTATDAGLAWSKDRGATWKYVRGKDYADKVRGLYGGPPKNWTETAGAALAEDYCTCLAEGSDGRICVGHRQMPAENFDADVQNSQALSSPTFAEAMLPQGSIIATYGDGTMEFGTHPRYETRPSTIMVVAMPSGSPAPTLAELSQQLARLAAIPPQDAAAAPTAITLEDDWSTQGDWLGRYGRYHAILAAMVAPADYRWGAGSEPLDYSTAIGPNHAPGDSIRYWVHCLFTIQRRSLELPPVYMHSRVLRGDTTWAFSRRQAEWDDHGERYPMTQAGPNIICNLRIPAGQFTLSLYDTNKDGHSDANRCRDYGICIFPHEADLYSMDHAPGGEASLACSRITNFWSGVYKRFWVKGPSTLSIKIDRNHSINAILAAVMLDSLDEHQSPYFSSTSQGGQPQKQQGQHPDAEIDGRSHRSSQQLSCEQCKTETEAAKMLMSEFDEMQTRNATWWTMNQRNIAVILARWCRSNLAGDFPAELLDLKASCFYHCRLYEQSEDCRKTRGEKTAREIEKSLRWDGVTPAYSGREYSVLQRIRTGESATDAGKPDR